MTTQEASHRRQRELHGHTHRTKRVVIGSVNYENPYPVSGGTPKGGGKEGKETPGDGNRTEEDGLQLILSNNNGIEEETCSQRENGPNK